MLYDISHNSTVTTHIYASERSYDYNFGETVKPICSKLEFSEKS